MTARASVRRAARTLGFAAAATGVLPLHAVHERLVGADERDALKERYKRAWCESMLRLFGVTIELSGAIPPRDRRGRLVVANHRGVIDVAILLRSFGGFMVSRADLARWPLVGAAARATGTLFVDRSDSMSGAQIIRAIRDKLTTGHTVTIFPEGTTFAGDEVRPFHAGSFLAAVQKDVDVVPVGIAYQSGSHAAFVDETFPQHLAKMAAAEPSRVVMAVGAPIPARGTRKSAHLAEQAHAAVVKLVAEARAAVDR